MYRFSKKQKEELIKQLMEQIPQLSQKIYPLYCILEWTWWKEKEKAYRIPTRKEIEEKLYELCKNIMNNNETVYVEAGGLYVRIKKHQEGGLIISHGEMGFKITEKVEMCGE